ncbi:unnamed protein product [Moneuplotes crassus]|uniref:Uncharacterized protein n=1 Tax=Euplotes crassus TaxID=5936 RepID=A0AAD2D3E6_EUPCR|nr:unnamed protein product [Moneuplotes crassus]
MGNFFTKKTIHALDEVKGKELTLLRHLVKNKSHVLPKILKCRSEKNIEKRTEFDIDENLLVYNNALGLCKFMKLHRQSKSIKEFDLCLAKIPKFHFEDEVVRSLPSEICNLRINLGVNTLRTRFQRHSRLMCMALSRTTDCVCLNSLILNKSQLHRVFVSASRCNKIIFHQCKLNSERLVLKDLDFKINTLAFMNCGLPNYSNWRDFPQKLACLLSVISNSSLRKSLLKISADETYLSERQKKELITRCNLDDVKIILF